MKPLALDLCCGKGGWTIGLQTAGWDVIGFDIEAWPGYTGDKFIQGDVRQIHLDRDGGYWILLHKLGLPDIKLDRKPDLICASPPCQEFSYSSFPFKKAREKFTSENPPDRSIWEACVRISKEVHAPLILENVRGAQKWMGKSVAHYGSFYLWGDVPPLLPIGRPTKGFEKSESRYGKGPLNTARDKRAFGGAAERIFEKNEFQRGNTQYTNSQSRARKEWSAKAAMIPLELSTWIGECFHPNQKEPHAQETP